MGLRGGVDRPSASSTEVTERADLFLCCLFSPKWRVLRTLQCAVPHCLCHHRHDAGVLLYLHGPPIKRGTSCLHEVPNSTSKWLCKYFLLLSYYICGTKGQGMDITWSHKTTIMERKTLTNNTVDSSSSCRENYKKLKRNMGVYVVEFHFL
jgi:hypothetical protein